MTDDELAEIEARLKDKYSPTIRDDVFAPFGRMEQDIALLLAEVKRLREHAIAARNFLVLNEPTHADRHLREALEDGADG